MITFQSIIYVYVCVCVLYILADKPGILGTKMNFKKSGLAYP